MSTTFDTSLLQQLQQTINESLNNYDYASRTFGADSPQAASALQNYGSAQAAVQQFNAPPVSAASVFKGNPYGINDQNVDIFSMQNQTPNIYGATPSETTIENFTKLVNLIKNPETVPAPAPIPTMVQEPPTNLATNQPVGIAALKAENAVTGTPTNPFSQLINGVLKIYGTNAGSELAELANIPSTVQTFLDQNIEGAKFAGPSSNYNFQQAGNTIVVTDKATGKIVSRVVAPEAGTQFQFSGGSPLTFTPTRTNNTWQINMGSTPLSQYVAPTGGATTSATTKAAPDINTLLTAAAGSDNRLSYGELMDFLNTNKLTLNQVSPFIGDESTRSGIMTDLGTYQTQLNKLNQSYNPADINWYGIENAKDQIANGGGGTDFSNSNMATQMEAYRQGLWTPKGMPTGGASMFTTPGLQDTVFLTSGLNAARQAAPNLSTNANLLVSTLARAIQDPSLGNVQAAVRVFQDPNGNRLVSSQDVAQASAYIKALTGDPNATYGSVLNRLDAGYGTLYNEQDFLNKTKTSLASYVDASLAIPSWDNKTRGEAFAKRITDLKLSPETAAASLGISVDALYRLAGGDPNIWAQLKSNKSTGDLGAIFSGVGSSSQGQSSSIYFPHNYIQLKDDPKIKSNVVNKDTPFAYDTKYVDLLNNQGLDFDQEFLGRIVLDVVDDAARDKTKPADLAAEIKRLDRLHNGFATQYLNAVGLADQISRYTGDGSFKLPDFNVSFPTGPGVSGSTAAQYIKPFPKAG